MNVLAEHRQQLWSVMVPLDRGSKTRACLHSVAELSGWMQKHTRSAEFQREPGVAARSQCQRDRLLSTHFTRTVCKPAIATSAEAATIA